MVKELSLLGSVRHDDYSDFGATTNYRIGGTWRVTDGFLLRSTYATSFRAPVFHDQLFSQAPLELFVRSAVAPSGVGTVPVFTISGGNPNLTPETAETFSAGVEIEPSFAPGLKFGVNYFDVDYRNKITQYSFLASMLVQMDTYRAIITQLPDQAALQAFIAATTAAGGVISDNEGLGTDNIRYIIDQRLRNLATVRQNGFDLSGSYSGALGSGTLSVRANVTIVNEILTGITPTSPEVNLVGTIGNPVRVRGRGDVGWGNANIGFNVAANYTDSFLNNAIAVSEPVERWVTFDITGRVSLAWLTGIDTLAGATLGLSVKNVLNTDPPYTRQLTSRGVNYDPANASPDGRVIGANLRYRW